MRGGNNLQINYKLSKAIVCINGKCIQTSFLLAKDITNQVILGTPFLTKIYPINRIDPKGIVGTFEEKDITIHFITEPLTKVLHDVYNNISVKKELNVLTINDRLQNQFSFKICRNNPNAFWDKRKHIISMPTKEGFDKYQISTKAKPCQTNLAYICREDIDILSHKGLINPRKSSWSGTTFYFYKNSRNNNLKVLDKTFKNGPVIPEPEKIVFSMNTEFLGNLNQIPTYYSFVNETTVLCDRKPVLWIDQQAIMIRKIETLPRVVGSHSNKIRITRNGYKGVIKQDIRQEYLVRFYSGKWNTRIGVIKQDIRQEYYSEHFLNSKTHLRILH